MVDGKARENLTALGTRKIGGRQVLDMSEQPRPHIGNDACGQPRIPALVPDGNDRGGDTCNRKHAEDLVQRLKVLLAECIVDQEFQAKRHDNVKQRLDQEAEADENQQLLVIAQMRPDEAVDRRQCACGFLGGEDDEIIVIVVELQLVVVFIIVVVVGRRPGRLAAGSGMRIGSLARKLLLELGIVRRHRILII